MTQENKELLLKDLCARLSYKLKVKLIDEDDVDFEDISIERGYANVWHEGSAYEMDEVKPYLRPMSSMTEEEKRRYLSFHYRIEHFGQHDISIFNYMDWLNAHHFDYRGLIEKGLAIEAPKELYKY